MPSPYEMSKQRNLRKSKLSFADEDEDKEDENGSLAVPPATVKAAQQQKLKEKKAEKKLSLLSFDEDTGEEAAGIGAVIKMKEGVKRKPNLRIPPVQASAHGAVPQFWSGSTYTQVASAGEYTAERLKELQKATLKAPKTGQSNNNIQPRDFQQPLSMPLPPPPMPPGAHLGQPRKPLSIEEEDDEDEGPSIPDSAAIRAAKAQREHLRSAHAAPDFIPLSMGGGAAAGVLGSEMHYEAGLKDLYGGTGKKDRKLVVEDEKERESDEDLELEEAIRLKFNPQGAIKPAQRKSKDTRSSKDITMVEAVQGPSDDEEETAWAEEQIRKGVRSSMLRGPPPAGTAAASAGGTRQGSQHPKAAIGAGAVSFLPPSQSAAVTAAADEVIANLRAALQRAQLSQRQAEKNLTRTERSLEECISGIARMEEEIKGAGDKYIFTQKIRAYVTDVCSMLAEKSPLVEELQEELQRAAEERAVAYNRRRTDRDTEERIPAEGAVSAALASLSQGAGMQQAEIAANAAAETAEKDLIAGSHIPVELDEFGRDANAHRRNKIKERLAVRREKLRTQKSQRLANEGSGGGEQGDLIDSLGDVTTSESESEVEGYSKRKEEVLEAGEAAFRDAADEFGSLSAVKQQLEEWKRRYPGQYNDAYMSESVPALFAPFIRLELLSWTPLDAPGSKNFQGIDQLAWHKLLFDYGMPIDGREPSHGDGDADLIPRLVKVLVLPIALAVVERLWDPFSAQESATIAAMLGELMVYLDPGSEGLVRIVQETQRRLEESVSITKVPSWPPHVRKCT